MPTVRIISPHFVQGFVKECYEHGLMEKEAAAILDGYIDATVTDQMEKKAVSFGRWLKEGLELAGRGAGKAWDATKTGAEGAGKFLAYPLTWHNTLGNKYGALGRIVGAAGVPVAYGAPVLGFDYYRSQSDLPGASMVRNLMGDDSWFGFGPHSPKWNGGPIIGIGGNGYGGAGGPLGTEYMPTNAYSGPMGRVLRPDSMGAGGLSGATSSGQWASGPESLARFRALNGNIDNLNRTRRNLEASLAKADDIEAYRIRDTISKIDEDINKARTEATQLQAASNEQLDAYKSDIARRAADAQEARERAARHTREVVNRNHDWADDPWISPTRILNAMGVGTSNDEAYDAYQGAKASDIATRRELERANKLNYATGVH